MSSSLFHIILPFFTCNKSGRGSETWERLVLPWVFFFPLAKGTLQQLHFLLLQRGTPWLNGKPEGSESSDNGNIPIYGSGGGSKNGGKKSREEATKTHTHTHKKKLSVAMSSRCQKNAQLKSEKCGRLHTSGVTQTEHLEGGCPLHFLLDKSSGVLWVPDVSQKESS